MDAQHVELMSALASLFQCGRYSDLTLTCGMKSYQVHRALVCSRSEFFEGACRNPFKESASGIIDLTEDDAEAVEHMVHYFYHLDYLNKPLSRRSSRRSSLAPRVPQRRRSKKLNLAMVEDPLLAMMSAASNTTQPMTPPEEQANQFDSDVPAKYPDMPMAEEYDDEEEESFEEVEPEPTPNEEKAQILIHAKVYAIADKYGIPGLKALARKKFAQQTELHWTSAEFADACQEAYETTVDSDRGLRDVVIQTFRANPSLSLRKDVELAVRETPGLAFELFRMASGLPVRS
ncbi:hypothetical protein EJ04DRAFT_337916 [Polyplosphaeria fusca]|uniref:BTB domain-containing protein n=1 Tax=Polyplosphaeria fusca TaxID=682080 RepID=A0A9P4QVL6_9PLEO|nr:hypothetical protein EJ04DRAFT_337916 [Polyplosphaeria fusca]